MELIYKERSSKRLPFYNKIVILRNSEESITANTFNISQNGIGIRSDQDIPVGTKILAHIFIGSETCEVEGKIEWSSKNPKSGSFKMGVELARFPDNFNEIYQKIVKRFNLPESDKPSLLDKFPVHKL